MKAISKSVFGLLAFLSSFAFAASDGAPGAPSIYESLGLRNGDVLMEVNGISTASPDTALQAMASLKDAKKVRLKVKRDGKVQLIERNVVDRDVVEKK